MLVNMLHNRATVVQIDQHARRALDAALAYFGQSNADFRVHLLADTPKDGGDATCSVNMEYLRATIRYSPDMFSEHPEIIWGTIGHEVAHIVGRELLEWRDTLVKPDTTEDRLYMNAVEALTTRLQRMFERDVPDPGWDAKEEDYSEYIKHLETQ